MISTSLITMSACSSLPANDDQVASENKEKKICTKEKITGSRFEREVCRTPSQIKAEAEYAKEISEERK